LPFQDQGIGALVLGDSERTYGEVPPAKPDDHGVERTCQGQITEGGDYRIQVRFSAWGERAVFYRHSLLDRNEAFRDRWVRQTFAQGLPGAEISDIKMGDLEDLSGQVKVSYSLALRDWGRRIDRLLLFRVPWAEPTYFEGPLTAQDRPQPLISPLVQVTRERHELEFPPGFTTYGLPFQVRQECPCARYQMSIRLEDNRLICERTLAFSGGLVRSDQFAQFKSFWVACTRADDAEIVLTRLDGEKASTS
jgi:hypothetical protein